MDYHRKMSDRVYALQLLRLCHINDNYVEIYTIAESFSIYFV